VTHNKAEVQHLSQRLESLEKQLVSEQQRVPAASVSVAPSTNSSRTAFGQELCGTLTNNLVQENGCECELVRPRYAQILNLMLCSMDLPDGDQCERELLEC
jgi:hypothetical protein